jgi:hypothetical protein
MARRESIQIRRRPSEVDRFSSSALVVRKISRKDGEWNDRKCGEGREASEANEALVEAPVVFDSLKPDPVVDAVEAVTLAEQAGDEVVVREVGVEHAPCRKDALPEEENGERRANCRFKPWLKRENRALTKRLRDRPVAHDSARHMV